MSDHSQEAARRSIESGTCPICGRGPFVVVSVHTNKKHGVDKYALRDMAGMTISEPTCLPEYSANAREKGQGRAGHMRELAEANKGRPASKSRRRTAAGVRRNAENLTRWIDENPDEIADLRATFRARMETPETKAKWERAVKESAGARVYTDERRQAFIELMASAEVEASRALARAATRIESCSVDGCDRDHVAKGLCALHYSRVQRDGAAGAATPMSPTEAAQKGRPGRRALSLERMDEARTLCASGMSQAKVAERLGVTQSIISRVVRGEYR